MSIEVRAGASRRDADPTYRIVIAPMVLWVEERLVRVQLMEIAIGVAMHFYAIRGGRDALVWAIYLVLRLGKSRGPGLAVLGHAIVEEILGRLG